MAKPVVSPQRFVEMLNERLSRHPVPGGHARLRHSPAQPAPAQPVCVGPRGTAGVCATIEVIVRGECDVFPDIARWELNGPRPGSLPH